MASSNRHWPSMFKSKPSKTNYHQWQHDINSSHISSGHHRNPYTPVPGCEERTPEPKPRWNPRPEQIRILEAIFNSGMVNPPRDEIRKIRVQLQEYGQVGDANVFYWFQNRKSRSKQKQRQLLQNNKSQLQPPPQTTTTPPPITAAAPTSSSSDKSSTNNSNYEKALPVSSSTVIDLLNNNNSPTASVNQPIFIQAPSEFCTEPSLFFPAQQNNGGSSTSAGLTQGFCFADIHHQNVGNQVRPKRPCLSTMCALRLQWDRSTLEKHLEMMLCYYTPLASQFSPMSGAILFSPFKMAHSIPCFGPSRHHQMIMTRQLTW